MSNKKNTLWNMIGSGTFSMTSFVLLVVVSRVFGIERAGDFGIAQSISQMLYIVGLFGANTYQMTDYKEKYKFSTYFSVKLLSNTLMMLCAISIAIVYKDWVRAFLIVGMSVYMCVYSFADLYQCFFFQKNRLDISGKSLFLQSIISSIIFIVVSWITENIFGAIIGMIIGNLVVSYLYSVRIYNDYEKIENAVEINDKTKALLKEVLPLFVSLFLMNIMTNLSKYFIDYYETQIITGIYNTLFVVFAVINLFSGFIFKPALNQYGKLLAENKIYEYVKKLAKQVIIVVSFTLMAALGGYVIGTVVLSWIYNVDLTQYKLELALICIGGGEIAFSSLLYYQLAILRKQTFIMIGYGLGAFIELVVCYFLVPKIGMRGGIISFLVAYAVLGLLLSGRLGSCLNKKRTMKGSKGAFL